MPIRLAILEDLPELIPLVRGYCEFYETDTPDEGIERVCRWRIDDPDRDGSLLVASSKAGKLVGFAALTWKASNLEGTRVAYLYDLFVAEEARGAGYGRALIDAAAEEARSRGCPTLDWLTAPGNERAQALYDSLGAERTEWVEYELRL